MIDEAGASLESPKHWLIFQGMFGPQADLRSGQPGLPSQQDRMQQQNQLGADREYAKQSSNLLSHSSFLPLSSTQPHSQTSQPSPVSDPHYIPRKKFTDHHTDSSLSLSEAESLSKLSIAESRSSEVHKSSPPSKEVTTLSHASSSSSPGDAKTYVPSGAAVKPPTTDSGNDSHARVGKVTSPSSPESVTKSPGDAEQAEEEEKSYEVTDDDVKRYLAFLNKPSDDAPVLVLNGEKSDKCKEEESAKREEKSVVEQGGRSEEGEEEEGQDSEEEPDSPGLLTAMTFYDHSPGEVYTIHEDEEEASSPTASDGVSRPRRKGRAPFLHANLLFTAPRLPTSCRYTRSLSSQRKALTGGKT